jgi:hypothetical protein
MGWAVVPRAAWKSLDGTGTRLIISTWSKPRCFCTCRLGVARLAETFTNILLSTCSCRDQILYRYTFAYCMGCCNARGVVLTKVNSWLTRGHRPCVLRAPTTGAHMGDARPTETIQQKHGLYAARTTTYWRAFGGVVRITSSSQPEVAHADVAGSRTTAGTEWSVDGRRRPVSR